jgi:hypothetical protein
MSIGNTVRPSVGVRQRVLVWVEELVTIRHSSFFKHIRKVTFLDFL